MGNLVSLIRPILFSFINNPETKKLICDLMDKYVKMTDNTVDDSLAAAVRIALLTGLKI